MNPNASLKSLNVKIRSIASRPGVSAHPGKPFSADFRASADSRSAMTAFLPFCTSHTLTQKGVPGIHAAMETLAWDRAGVVVRPFFSSLLSMVQDDF
jgi:hypothetical protein